MAVTAANTEVVKQAVAARFTTSQQLLAFAEILLLSVWLGSMAFFSFAVAPGAFAALPSRHLAGLMVTNAISKVEMIGLVTGPLLILIQAATWRARRASRAGAWVRFILVLVMTAAAALSRFWVSPAMSSLRNSMGGLIDDVAASDPLRVEFNGLHQYSVALMSVALFSGLAVLFLTVRSLLRR